MPFPKDDRFDCSNLLLFSEAQRLESQQAPFDPDNAITVFWDVPYGAGEECRRHLYENSQVITDTETRFDLLEGTWRLQGIEVGPVRNRQGEIESSRVSARYAKGYYTTLNWETARVEQKSEVISNSQDVDSVAGTASDNPDKSIVVIFPYCSPDSEQAIVASLRSADPNSKEIRGEDIGTGWTINSAQSQRQDDGTYTIRAFIGRTQYTLKSFSDLGGNRQADIYYMWDIPKSEAQSILDAFKSAHPVGSSATVNYDRSAKLANITFSVQSSAKPNLSLEDINIACNRTQSIHFAWGYEEGDIDTFIGNHNDPITAGEREVRVNERGDGLYDIQIVEIYITGPKQIEFENFYISDYRFENHYYRWDATADEVEAFVATHDDKEANMTRVVTVSEKAQCVFDVRIIETRDDPDNAAVEATFSIGDMTNITKEWGFKVSKATVEAAEARFPSTANVRGESYNFDVEQLSDYSYNYVATKAVNEESRETVDYEDDGLIRVTEKKRRNSDDEYSIGEDLGKSESQINNDGLIDKVLRTFELSPSLESFTNQRELKANQTETEYRFWNQEGSVTSRQDISGGNDAGSISYSNGRRVEKTQSLYMIVKKEREVTISESITWAIAPLSASQPDPEDLPDDGSYEETVEIVRAGLWKKTVRITTNGDWGDYTLVKDWTPIGSPITSISDTTGFGETFSGTGTVIISVG